MVTVAVQTHHAEHGALDGVIVKHGIGLTRLSDRAYLLAVPTIEAMEAITTCEDVHILDVVRDDRYARPL